MGGGYSPGFRSFASVRWRSSPLVTWQPGPVRWALSEQRGEGEDGWGLLTGIGFAGARSLASVT